MLQAKTKEQKKKVLEILGTNVRYCSFPLDFNKETDWGYEAFDDRIYSDGSITFDTMAKIVDYLRGQKRTSNPDVPDRAVIKQLLIENGKLKSEIQYLENELANKNRAIKAFKK